MSLYLYISTSLCPWSRFLTSLSLSFLYLLKGLTQCFWNADMPINYLGIWLTRGFWFTGFDLRFCISNEPPDGISFAALLSEGHTWPVDHFKLHNSMMWWLYDCQKCVKWTMEENFTFIYVSLYTFVHSTFFLQAVTIYSALPQKVLICNTSPLWWIIEIFRLSKLP